jgi:CDP-diacylglycerol--serine O-phosphatidyltransferase
MMLPNTPKPPLKSGPPNYRDADEASHIYLLPNSLTAGNLFFGFLAILRCIQANYAVESAQVVAYFNQAVWFILFAVICDALDDRVARLGGRESLFGKEFDSIADVVSFGVAPTLMMIFLVFSPTESYPMLFQLSWVVAFIYLLCAAIRLARFNVLTHPMLAPSKHLMHSKDFLGLPVPAAAAMVASLVLVLNTYELQPWALGLPFLMLGVSYLMISQIPYPSFKEVGWHTRSKLPVFIGAIIAIVLIFSFRPISFMLVMIAYIALGPIRFLYRAERTRRLRRERAQKTEDPSAE